MRYYVFVKSSFKHTRDGCESKRACDFRCLIISLSVPRELLFLLCFIAYLTREVVSVMLYPCMFCVALSMDLFVLYVACLTVFVNCLVKQFVTCLGVFVILLLNVIELSIG